MAQTTRRLPPGPDGLPLVDNTLAIARDGLGFSETLPAYGDLVAYRAFGEQFVAVFDPDVVETVLVTRNDEFRKGDFEQSLGDAFAPRGVAFAEDDEWRRQRTALQPAFAPDRIRGFADQMAACATALAAEWDDGEVVAVDDAFSTLALRVLARTLFDVDLDADRGRVVRDAVHAISGFVDATPVRSLLPGWLPSRTERRLDDAMSDLHSLVDQLLAEADGDDLLARIRHGPDGDPMDTDVVRDQLVTFLFAGHETTATALTYATWLLATHPEAADRVRADVDAGDPTDAADAPFLDAVVKEALRLYPPVYALYRQPREDTTLAGYHVPEEATLQLATYNLQRDDRYWEDPDEFKPERWLAAEDGGRAVDDRGPTADDRPEYAYFPFGGGPRHCIGVRFATLELRVVLAALLERVAFRPVTEGPSPSMGLTLDPGTVELMVAKR